MIKAETRDRLISDISRIKRNVKIPDMFCIKSPSLMLYFELRTHSVAMIFKLFNNEQQQSEKNTHLPELYDCTGCITSKREYARLQNKMKKKQQIGVIGFVESCS